MKTKLAILAFCLTFILCGCGKSIPPDKSAYVGEWQQQSMYLMITQDGSVTYSRSKGKVHTAITNGPIQGFDGNNFDVGIGSLKTTFVVDKPPYKDGEQWKMVVDGVELTKKMQ